MCAVTEARLAARTGLWHDAWRRLQRNRAALAALALLAAIVVAALAAPLLARYPIDHVDWNLSPLAQPPSLANGHWFGTDANGRWTIQAYHTSAREAGEIAEKAKVKMLVMTHLIPADATEQDFLKEARKGFSGKIMVGRDLMHIELPFRPAP